MGYGIPPIPLGVLRNKCLLELYSKSGVYGDETLISSTELTRVSVDFQTATKRSGGQSRKIYGGVLYFDCRNSRPNDAVFLGCNDGLSYGNEECSFFSAIVFKGHTMAVEKVRYIYGAGVLHHIEVEFGER